MTTPGRPRIDYTHKDFSSLRDAMLELARERLPEWTDHSPNDLGVTLVELFASMGDALFYDQDRIANEAYLETAREPRSILHLLRLIGCELRPPVPASAQLSLYFEQLKPEEREPADRQVLVVIPLGAEFRTTREATGTPVHFRYLRPTLTLDLKSLPVMTLQGTEYRVYNTLPVVQVDAEVKGEIIASSDGDVSQRYPLARPHLLDDSLVVSVQEGSSTPRIWKRQGTLLYSSGADEHYVVRRDEDDVAWLEFGDGRYGKRPPRGRNNISASYRVGGGSHGNVPPGTISKVVTDLPRLKRVTHSQPASGGADREPLAEAVRRGPQLFRSMGRAVTAADYEAHARSLGVAKARVVAAGPRVDLYVAPVGGGQPSDSLKEDLRVHFEDKRIVTSIVRILGPTYVEVLLEGILEVEPLFQRNEVQRRVEDALRALWTFDRVDFGDTLYVSKVYEAVEAIDGVAGVSITRFGRGDAPPGTPGIPEAGRLSFTSNEIPVSRGFSKLGVIGGHSDG